MAAYLPYALKRINALNAHSTRLHKRLLDARAGVTVHSLCGIGYLLKKN